MSKYIPVLSTSKVRVVEHLQTEAINSTYLCLWLDCDREVALITLVHPNHPDNPNNPEPRARTLLMKLFQSLAKLAVFWIQIQIQISRQIIQIIKIIKIKMKIFQNIFFAPNFQVLQPLI